ncbi:pilus assembly protein PilM [Horticoccus luteus]|uniref:Pilus assembly protein PilM n=1 Tax=Horticoccus luteus TaxID=2862869 RepID=A0A8F9TVR2_9BACT|nr:pilus assembly protein PilM [Horticoccus luteus]QYM80011.1 pilus assembly protein PilM [Horticoccus luteus]
MRFSRSFVVDCGASHVACCKFTTSGRGGLRVAAFSQVRHLADPAADVGWADGVVEAVATARAAGWGTQCTLVLPGHLALTKFGKTASVAPAKRERIIAFEAAQNIPYPLEDVVWDHLETADDGLDVEFMLAAAKRDLVEDLCARVEAAGVAVTRVLPASLALRRALAHNYEPVESPAVVVDVGARSSHVLLVEPGGRFALRTFTLGGNTLTQAIADELRLDFAHAEALKLQVLGAPSGTSVPAAARAAVERAAAAFAARLQAEVMRSMANFTRQGGTAATRLYLAGGGAAFPVAREAIAAGMGVPVERYDAWRHVTFATAAEGEAEATSAAAQLVGAAVPVTGAAAAFNLVPPALAARGSERRRQWQWLAAAALVIVSLTGPAWYFQRRARAADAESRRLTAQLQPVRRARAHNEAILAQLAETEKQSAALSRVFATRANWLAFFGDLQSRLVKVEDVWLEKMQDGPPVAGGPAPAEGAAPPPRRLTLSGRLLDRQNPVSQVSRDSYEHVRALLADLRGSRFVAAVENERFDNTQPGILRFDCTLVINPQHPL